MNGNVEFKARFLEDVEKNFNIRVKEQYEVLFGDKQIGFTEGLLNKDVYDFTRDEILLAYKNLEASKMSSLTSSHSLLNKYILYSFDKKISKLPAPSTINITREDLKPLISKRKLYNRYMTTKEMNKVIINLNNDQDRAMLMLIFFKSILGKNYEDLIGLKKEDFSYAEGYLNVNGVRYNLSDIEKEVLFDAISESNYINYTLHRHRETPLIISDYIFRNVAVRKTKTFDYDPMTPIAIRGRLKKIVHAVDKPEWSGKTIFASGIVNRMLDEKEDWSYTEVLSYINENNYNLNATDLQDVISVIKEKRKNEE